MFVYVGLVDQEISEKVNVAWETNRIGGLPKWMTTNNCEVEVKCQQCGAILTLVTQIYCPLPDSPYHRCLYIFLCCREDCIINGSWRVFRSQLYDSTYLLEKPADKTSDTTMDTWMDDQDDWNDPVELSDPILNTDFENRQLKSNDHTISAKNHHGGAEKTKSHQPDFVADDWLDGQGDWGDRTTQTEHRTPPNATPHHFNFANENSSLADNTVTDLSKLSLEESNQNFQSKDLVKTKGCTSSMEVLEDQQASEPNIVVEDTVIPDPDRLSAMARILNWDEKSTPQSSGKRTQDSLSTTVVFKSFYVDVIEEPEDVPLDPHVLDLLSQYEQENGQIIGQLQEKRHQKGHSETYEKNAVKHGDQEFHKFQKRLKRCQGQVIRYSHGGEPLLPCRLMDQQSFVPNCLYCGAKRVFELQLLPSLIHYLRSQENFDTEVDFGSVLIYTCEKSCWPEQRDPNFHLLRDESIIVLTGADSHLFQ